MTTTQAPPQETREPGSRRNWIVLALIAALLVVTAGAVGWWIGSLTAGDEAADEAELPEVVERWVDAMMAGDAEAYAALFTDDGVTTGPSADRTRGTITGSRIDIAMGNWFSFVTFTAIEPVAVMAEADTVAVEWTWKGTSSTHHRGASDQTPFSATAFTVHELEGNLIARVDAYYTYDEVAT